MSQENQRFIEAERTAEQLVKSLQALQRETSLYQSNSEQLEALRGKLGGMIDAATENAKQTRDLIVGLKTFAPEVLANQNQLRQTLKINTYLIAISLILGLGTVVLMVKLILIK